MIAKIKSRIRRFWLSLQGAYFTLFIKRYKTSGFVFDIPYDMTTLRFRSRFVRDSYEKEERKHLATYLPASAKVLEMGACLGVISCITNRILTDQSRHVVLEANPHLIHWIEKNKDSNQCSFSVENAIISNEKENTFFLHKLIVGGSTKRKTAKETIVRGTSFTELEARYGFDFDTLICDIEGGELDLLRTFRTELGRFKMIFIEIHPFGGILTKEEAHECEKTLEEEGFEKILTESFFQIWQKPEVTH